MIRTRKIAFDLGFYVQKGVGYPPRQRPSQFKITAALVDNASARPSLVGSVRAAEEPMSTWRVSESSVRPFVRAVLLKARDRGVTDVGPTKVLGLLYLLDVAHWARYREPATPIEWVWKEYGPFDRDAAYDAKTDPWVEEIHIGGQYTGSVYRLQSGRTLQLEQRTDALLDEVMDRFGSMNGTAIKRYCYKRTEPMIHIQFHGQRGEALDMSLARVEGAPFQDDLEVIQQAVDFLGTDRPETNSHREEFLDLIEDGHELRRRANAELLDRQG